MPRVYFASYKGELVVSLFTARCRPKPNVIKSSLTNTQTQSKKRKGILLLTTVSSCSLRADSHFDISIGTSINTGVRKMRKIRVNRGYISIRIKISICTRNGTFSIFSCLCLRLRSCLCNPASQVFFAFFLCLCLNMPVLMLMPKCESALKRKSR